MKDRITERAKQRKREVFHPLVQSSDCHSSGDWAPPMLGSRSFISVSIIGAGVQALGTPYLRGGSAVDYLELELVPYWGYKPNRQQIYLLCHSTGHKK